MGVFAEREVVGYPPVIASNSALFEFNEGEDLRYIQEVVPVPGFEEREFTRYYLRADGPIIPSNIDNTSEYTKWITVQKLFGQMLGKQFDRLPIITRDVVVLSGNNNMHLQGQTYDEIISMRLDSITSGSVRVVQSVAMGGWGVDGFPLYCVRTLPVLSLSFRDISEISGVSLNYIDERDARSCGGINYAGPSGFNVPTWV